MDPDRGLLVPDPWLPPDAGVVLNVCNSFRNHSSLALCERSINCVWDTTSEEQPSGVNRSIGMKPES